MSHESTSLRISVEFEKWFTRHFRDQPLGVKGVARYAWEEASMLREVNKLERELDFQDEQNGRLSARVVFLERTLQEIQAIEGAAAGMATDVLNIIREALDIEK